MGRHELIYSSLINPQKQRWKDTDEIIKSQQGADNLFVGFHDNVDSWTNTFVHQLYKEKNDNLEIRCMNVEFCIDSKQVTWYLQIIKPTFL